MDDLIELTSLHWRAIYTTNYDRGILRAYELNPNPPQTPKAIAVAADLVDVDPRLDVPIYFLHGALGIADSDVLITEDDYSLFQHSRKMLFDSLRLRFTDCTFLYIGYSNEDPNWAMLQAEIRAEFATSTLPQAFRIAPVTSELDRELLLAKGITTLDGTLDQFVAAVKRQDIHGVSAALPSEQQIPEILQPAYASQAASVLRFLNSWEVCNEADFAAPPNTAAFLRGDLPNWGTIDRGHTFERDLKAEVYERLLDYATTPRIARPVALVLGAAGYGVSTLLMQVTYAVIRDKAAVVFRLKPGGQVIEGDILFGASQLTEARAIFVIDDATKWKRSIRSALHLLSQSGQGGAFLLGARTNEWRSSEGRLRPTEYSLEPLSDPEIDRLLDLLERTAELGELRHLDRDARFAQIKVRSEKDLLVTLREVTEGKLFDEIVRDEYSKIPSEEARNLYALVSALFQEGQYLRDTVAARVLNCSTDELFALLDQLTGIVFHELIDEANGIYGFRGRHRVISKLVWMAFISGPERERLLLLAMKALNLTYASDRSAFEILYRSTEIVDSMPSLEARIDYFESASFNDPTNPFVKQHFARMFLRAGRLEMAFAQIELALKRDARSRSLHHTKGKILSHQAIAAPSIEVGRRYLAQAEAEFSYCISADGADDYAYQTLAELYRQWAGRLDSPEDSAAYYRRAEEVIFTGLRRSYHHYYLHIESARIAEDLGKRPEQLEALKRAVEVDTASEYARYLYGRELRQRGRFEEAVAVLRPIFLTNPAAFRTAIELALAQIGITANYAEGVAILKQVAPFASTDARFITVLGGMQFLAHRLDEAKRTFILGHSVSADEQKTVYYRPTTKLGDFPSSPIWLEGTVSRVAAGYMFISVPGYLDVFCPTSRVRNRRYAAGDRVRFIVSFTPRGAAAETSSIERLDGRDNTSLAQNSAIRQQERKPAP